MESRVINATVALLLATSSGVAFADWKFEPRLAFEYVTGSSNEDLQLNNGSDLFEIEGDLNSLWRLDLGLTVKPADWMRVNIDYAFKIDDGDVKANEFAWLVPFSDWSDAAVYSNATVTNSTRLDINADFAVYRFDQILITAGFGYRADDLEWKTSGGSYTASVGGFRDISGSLPPGASLNAQQQHSTFYLSFGAEADFDTFVLGANFLYGPMSKIDSTNTYRQIGGFSDYLPNMRMEQDFDDTTMYGVVVSGRYRYNNRLTISLDYRYTKYDQTNGQMVISGTEVSQLLGSTVEGTFESDESVISFGVSYRFN